MVYHKECCNNWYKYGYSNGYASFLSLSLNRAWISLGNASITRINSSLPFLSAMSMGYPSSSIRTDTNILTALASSASFDFCLRIGQSS